MKYNIKFTGNNPAHPHVYSVCCNNKGYYYNTISGSVSTYNKGRSGFVLVSVKDKTLINAIKKAFTEQNNVETNR